MSCQAAAGARLGNFDSVAFVFGKVLTQRTDRTFFFADSEFEFPINFLRACVVPFLEHPQMGLC